MNGDIELGGDGIITGALVSGNVIYDNGDGGGSGINMDGVQNSRIENNLLYDNQPAASRCTASTAAAGRPATWSCNNTIHQAADGRWALNIRDGSTGNTVLNNILVTQPSSRGAIDISADSLSGFTSDYNVVVSRFTTNGGNSNQTLAQWQASTNRICIHSWRRRPSCSSTRWLALGLIIICSLRPRRRSTRAPISRAAGGPRWLIAAGRCVL